MFQMKKSLFAVVALAAAVSAPKAFALPGVDLGIMAGAGLSMPSLSGVDGGIGISAGATAGIGPIEASLLYSQYRTSLLVTETTSNYLEIPLLFRAGLGPVSFGIGGFYSMFLSGSQTVSGTTTEITDGDSNYGATASARFTVPVLGFFVDGRYNLGLKDMSGSTASSAAVYLGWNFL